MRFRQIKTRSLVVVLAGVMLLFLALRTSLFATDEMMAQSAYRQLLAGNVKGPGGALALYQRALEKNPASPYRWCDFGEASLDGGNPTVARLCMTRAALLGPRMPPILLRAANLAFRLDDSDAALDFGSRVLALVPDYDEIVFSTYDRMGIPSDTVLQRGVPHDRRAAQAYSAYLLQSHRPELAAQIREEWK